MPTRRRVLRAGALLPLGGLGWLPRVSAAEARLEPGAVRMEPGIAPLVKLIEDLPRERLIEEMAHRVRGGLPYPELLAALLLAGVRNVQPRPVGFKFHAVLVVHSAHLASVALPSQHRWLPIFWALDHFKISQADEKRKTGWTMGPLEGSRVPSASKARQAFIDAMERWEPDDAEAAAAALARTAGSHETFELFCQYGMRDFRDIGHKTIFVANGWRALQSIGWQHAEPVLRSLARALLYYDGNTSPAGADLDPDRPWKRNRALAATLRPAWRDGKPDDGAAAELFQTMCTATEQQTVAASVAAVNRGTSAQTVWDACFAAAAEMNMARPDILSLHALTTLNAARHCFETTADDQLRRMLLLQSAAFLPRWRGKLDRKVDLSKLEAAPLKTRGDEAIEEIFLDVSRDKPAASRKVLAYAAAGEDPNALIAMARVLTCLKGTSSHDYKFSSAVLEDHGHLSPPWRDRLLAASVYQLSGSQGADNGLIRRIRSAFGS